jgi:3-hydroxyacyl-CoA dehydrogenase/enoyl-CoA hydratase/3-hydroxybutyryl-CoA epimerase
MDRLMADVAGEGVSRADVIIEAVFENLEVKQAIFREIEKKAKKEAIIATNTSSIPLEDIAKVMQDPSRLVGIHYFNPVAKMELVEVVASNKTTKEVCQQAYAFVNQIKRLPVPVKSSPGFLVNRVLMPYLMECVYLLEEGYSPELIDKAATDFGMFMGPVELADTVGMDVCLAVAENLTQQFGGNVPEKLKEMVKQEKLGCKTGEGFYRYKNRKPIKHRIADETSLKEISDRLILRLINEAKACLKEGVVQDGDLLDAALIFGAGFAPFRGGPIYYSQSMGN